MKSILECNNPQILEALNKGKVKFKMDSENNLIKARAWVNKHLLKQIKKAASKGCKSFSFRKPFFIDKNALVKAYKEYDFLNAILEISHWDGTTIIKVSWVE